MFFFPKMAFETLLSELDNVAEDDGQSPGIYR